MKVIEMGNKMEKRGKGGKGKGKGERNETMKGVWARKKESYWKGEWDGEQYERKRRERKEKGREERENERCIVRLKGYWKDYVVEKRCR